MLRRVMLEWKLALRIFWQKNCEFFATGYGIIQVADFFAPKFEIMNAIKDYECLVIVGGMVCGVLGIVCHFKSVAYKIDSCDISVSLVVGHIEQQNCSIAISTNTSFITDMTNEIISAQSAQGAVEMKFFKNNIDELDNLLRKELKSFKKKELENVRVNGKTYPKYPVGTVVNVRKENRRIYFSALDDINEYGQCVSHKMENIYACLSSLWENIPRIGHCENELAITLFGSGKAGIAEATKEVVFMSIVDSFIVATQNNGTKIANHLIIVIHPNDVKNINIEKMEDYLRYRTQFITSSPGVDTSSKEIYGEQTGNSSFWGQGPVTTECAERRSQEQGLMVELSADDE